MKIFLSILIIIFSCMPVFASNFGEYKYTKYLGIQQQLQNQRNMALRRQMKYRTNPTANIYYPRVSGTYPNIEHGRYQRLMTKNQRYSPQYYRNYYSL